MLTNGLYLGQFLFALLNKEFFMHKKDISAKTAFNKLLCYLFNRYLPIASRFGALSLLHLIKR